MTRRQWMKAYSEALQRRGLWLRKEANRAAKAAVDHFWHYVPERVAEVAPPDHLPDYPAPFRLDPKSLSRWNRGSELPKGWIAWAGGECPLEPGIEHERLLRDKRLLRVRCEATDMLRRAYWQHHGTDNDIVAYRKFQS